MEYEDNIDELIADGNGATAVADIINAEAVNQKLAYAARGILCDADDDRDANVCSADRAADGGAQPDAEKTSEDVTPNIGITADDGDSTVGGDSTDGVVKR